MTQEEKQLLLVDLSARLPYGVKVKITSRESKNRIVNLTEDNICHLTNDWWSECKPYLFPLSSMTEEQLFKVQSILGKNEIKIEDGFLRIVDSDRNTISYLEILALLEWFYKNNFDIKGLIEKGLAIDCTNLNIY